MRKVLAALLATGERYHSPLFTLISRPSSGYRIGFLARRNIGTAVARNRAKRRIRHGWKRLKPAGDYLFSLKNGALRATGAELAAELTRVSEKICLPPS